MNGGGAGGVEGVMVMVCVYNPRGHCEGAWDPCASSAIMSSAAARLAVDACVGEGEGAIAAA